MSSSTSLVQVESRQLRAFPSLAYKDFLPTTYTSQMYRVYPPFPYSTCSPPSYQTGDEQHLAVQAPIVILYFQLRHQPPSCLPSPPPPTHQHKSRNLTPAKGSQLSCSCLHYDTESQTRIRPKSPNSGQDDLEYAFGQTPLAMCAGHSRERFGQKKVKAEFPYRQHHRQILLFTWRIVPHNCIHRPAFKLY